MKDGDRLAEDWRESGMLDKEPQLLGGTLEIKCVKHGVRLSCVPVPLHQRSPDVLLEIPTWTPQQFMEHESQMVYGTWHGQVSYSGLALS